MSQVLGIAGAGRFGRLAADLADDTGQFDKTVFFDDHVPVDQNMVIGKLGDITGAIKNGVIQKLLIAIGYKHFDLRQSLYESHCQEIPFATLVHPTTFVSKKAKISDGVMIFSKCNIEMGTVISSNVTIFNQTSITHDVAVGRHSFLSVGVRMGGGVKIGERTFMGVNSTLINDIVVGDDCIVCGATFLTKSIPSGTCVIGNPFRTIDRVFL